MVGLELVQPTAAVHAWLNVGTGCWIAGASAQVVAVLQIAKEETACLVALLHLHQSHPVVAGANAQTKEYKMTFTGAPSLLLYVDTSSLSDFSPKSNFHPYFFFFLNE